MRKEVLTNIWIQEKTWHYDNNSWIQCTTHSTLLLHKRPQYLMWFVLCSILSLRFRQPCLSFVAVRVIQTAILKMMTLLLRRTKETLRLRKWYVRSLSRVGMGGSHCDRFNRNYADLSQAFILIPKNSGLVWVHVTSDKIDF